MAELRVRHAPRWNVALIAGTVMLAACILSGLIKAVPHPGFPMLLAAYLGAALIFWARMRSEASRVEARSLSELKS